MKSEQIEVLCLPRYPQLYEQTLSLLNNQWPRSRTARLRSLEQGSKEGLPTSLVLVEILGGGERKVIAHSKISPVPYKPQWCFVESVVVDPQLRGKGFGRLIMEGTEEYVKTLGVTTVYLTTYDQQEFYKRLGYDFTQPIVVFGGSTRLSEKAQNLVITNIKTETINIPSFPGQFNSQDTPVGPPPPPPPPPSCATRPDSEPAKVTMRKVLI